MKISEKLKKAMVIRNISQAELVERTGINKGAISSYLSDRYEPKQKNIYLLANALDINEAWLMGYDVEMDKLVDDSTIKLTSSEETVVKAYRKADDHTKKVVNVLLEIDK